MVLTRRVTPLLITYTWCIYSYVLRVVPGILSTTTLVDTAYVHTELASSRNSFTFLLRPQVFSRKLGCAARKEFACTPRRKCEPRPRSVARALGLQSREFWQTTTGSHSDLLEPSRTMETPTILQEDFCLVLGAGCCCCFCIKSDHTVPRAVRNEAATEQEQSLVKLLLL